MWIPARDSEIRSRSPRNVYQGRKKVKRSKRVSQESKARRFQVTRAVIPARTDRPGHRRGGWAAARKLREAAAAHACEPSGDGHVLMASTTLWAQKRRRPGWLPPRARPPRLGRAASAARNPASGLAARYARCRPRHFADPRPAPAAAPAAQPRVLRHPPHEQRPVAVQWIVVPDYDPSPRPGDADHLRERAPHQGVARQCGA